MKASSAPFNVPDHDHDVSVLELCALCGVHVLPARQGLHTEWHGATSSATFPGYQCNMPLAIFSVIGGIGTHKTARCSKPHDHPINEFHKAFLDKVKYHW